MSDTQPATLKDVRDYFKQEGENLTDFGKEWKELSDKDKDDLKKGIGDGTFTY